MRVLISRITEFKTLQEARMQAAEIAGIQ